MKIGGFFFFWVGGGGGGGADWPNWRGPHYDGSTEETGLPEQFGPQQQCLWSAAMPGPAASTPVVHGDSVFLTSTDEAAGTLVGLCLDRKTGVVRWRQEIGRGFRQDARSTFAGPSPVTDGERVIFFFGTGDLAAFDFSGKLLWKRQIQEEYGNFAFLWTFSSSPVLFGGKLYLQVLQRDVSFEGNGSRRGKAEGLNESYLLAMDPGTGKEVWRVVRPAEALAESLESFATPMPWTQTGRTELLVAGGDVLTGHDAATGRELWRSPSWNPEKISHWRLVPGPVAGDGVVLGCAPKRAPVYAWRAGGTGLLTGADQVWVSGDGVNSRDVSSDVATPLYYRGRFYVANSDRKSLACLEPRTGKLFWEYRVEGGAKIEASPLGADGKVFLFDQRGTVTVLSAGDEPKLRHTVAFGGPGEKDIRSSPVVAHGCLFLRTNETLYCVGTAP